MASIKCDVECRLRRHLGQFSSWWRWPGTAPGDTGDIGAEHAARTEDATPIIKVENVTRPTISVYRPPQGKANGAAVVVCPGGGYWILAMDIEGTEICQWLNSVGVTAILLKYRVPPRKGRERYEAPLQDAQRAMGLVRHHAEEWGIDPKRVGVLGFSAGGHLSAALSTNNEVRTYPTADSADRESCRPDFTLLIYPAYLVPDNNMTHLAPEIHVTAKTPPAFLVQTEDDGIHVENARVYAQALRSAGVLAELHIYAKGGHGYGLRPSSNPVSHWPRLAAAWLTARGFLTAR